MPPSKTLPQVFIIISQATEITHSSRTAFSEDLFFPNGKGGGGDYGAKKISKLKPTRVLVASFVKFHHLCYLYIFGFFFIVP